MSYPKIYHQLIASVVAGRHTAHLPGQRTQRQEIARCLRVLHRYDRSLARKALNRVYWIGYPVR